MLDRNICPNTNQHPHLRYLISESNFIKSCGKLWIYYLFIPRNYLSKCFSCFSSLPTGSPYAFRAGLVMMPSLPKHTAGIFAAPEDRACAESQSLFSWTRASEEGELASKGINQVHHLPTISPTAGCYQSKRSGVQRNQGKHRLRARKQRPGDTLASIMSACMRTSLCTRTFFPVLVLKMVLPFFSSPW